MFALIAACGGGGNGDDAEPPGQNGTSSGLDAVAVATVTPPLPATPTPTLEEVLRGFAYPIEDGCLPGGNQLMPNAPREYRQGTHEGVDFYDVDNCTPVTIGTPVLAAKQGTVVRVDHDYQDPTFEQMSAYLADPLKEASLDALRGRQVWVDHGGGVVTRYCHLSGIAEGLKEGDVIQQGALLGMVGESGTPESLSNPGSEYHLHWEVRIGDSFLGAGEEPDQVRALYQALFEP